MPRRPPPEKCLATLYPDLAQEWHPRLNGDLTPQDVTAKSGQKVWWRCAQGHDYQAVIDKRTPPRSQGCPYCSGRRATVETCLATLHPGIAQEWHPDKNGPLTPQEVTAGSSQKVWWRCKKGHDYQARIADRTPPKSNGCPVCSGRQVHQDNCLATRYPKVAQEWHPEKNGLLTPQGVTAGSGQKVWWRCARGHPWQAVIGDRTPPKSSGCPVCSGRQVHQDNCLASLHPEIAQEWHPSLNGDLTPQGVTAGSHKKVWWRCAQGHQWQAQINSRTPPISSGCPQCALANRGQRPPPPEKCLATLHPEIAQEWHPSLNGDLTPQGVTAGSDKKVWWRCAQGHDYQARVADRTPPNPTGCPYCAGKRVNAENCLATLHPEVAQEWHPEKNGTLTPQGFTAGSHKKVWWLCPRGHPWQAQIDKRTPPQSQGCPVCSGRQVHQDNCLATRYPEIAQEWHPDKNGTLTPQGVTAGSSQKVWWLCPRGHPWQAQIDKRTPPQSQGCPYCAGKRATAETCLATLHPEIAQEWHPDKNGPLTPQGVTAKSHKKVWWRCPRGHDYQATISHRTPPKSSGCPYCSGRRATAETCLATLYPDLAQEWHPDKNGTLTPQGVTAGSDKKVWWRCARGHQWQAQINNRTPPNPTGCPDCSGQTSGPECRLFAELRALFGKDNVNHREKIGGKEVDIYLAPYKIAIEYDGSYYHHDKEDQDQAKTRHLQTQGVRLWRMRHHPLPKLSPDDVIHQDNELSKADIEALLGKLGPDLSLADKQAIAEYQQGSAFRDEAGYKDLLACLPGPLAEESLTALYPEIAQEWHPERNAPLEPEGFHPNSNQKVWWLCAQGHEWQARIAKRTPPQSNGCPICSGRQVHQDNCLATLHPEIAQEWHPEKNGTLTPQGVTAGSNQKVWWRCAQGHDYQARVGDRTPPQSNGCPYCAGQRVNAENCLATLHPEIAQEWHPDKNGPLTPQDVTANSGQKVWWRCAHGHPWQAVIANRTPPNPRGCPVCSGRQVHQDNCLATLHPEVAQEWHPNKNGPLTPQGVTAGSGQKVWWRCARGHQWQAVIHSRTPPNPRGCPVCSGRQVHQDNCLATLHPEIAQEWHPDKNGTLTPQDVTAGSNQKVWWRCPRGHDYQAMINSRTPPISSGCPVCSGRQVHQDNCLATRYPEIAQEWHPEKNGTLTPQDVTANSGQKAWWRCAHGHQWQAQINSRTPPQSQGCPVCSGRQVHQDNCLATLHPEIAQEWHPDKNGLLTPQGVTTGSNKKVWWRCAQGHQWQALINSRTPPKSTGCPQCARAKRQPRQPRLLSGQKANTPLP